MRIFVCTLFMMTLAACSDASSTPKLLWETAGFEAPESAVLSSDGETIYVSNVAGDGAKKDGNGYISTLGRDGKIKNLKWATGLDAPKGLALSNGKLYAADIDQLVAIDTATGQIAARYPAPGAKFLNDTAADSQGRVYVSDMFTDTIWRLDGETFEAWVVDKALKGPNGLLVDGNKLVVGAWGEITEGFSTKSPGYLITVSLDDKKVKTLGNGKPVGHLDGVEPKGDGTYLVTDWIAGNLMNIKKSGEAKILIDLPAGSADHAYIASEKTVVIPMMQDGVVKAYQLK